MAKETVILLLLIQVPNCMDCFCEGIWRTSPPSSSLDNASVQGIILKQVEVSVYICIKNKQCYCCCIEDKLKNGFKKKEKKNSLWQRKKKHPQPRVVLLAHFYRDELFLLVIF